MDPDGGGATDPAGEVIGRIVQRGVQVERWPTGADGRASGVAGHGSGPSTPSAPTTPADRPVLYLVEPGVAPPTLWGELEDWVRLPADAEELHSRADRLSWRAGGLRAARIVIDDDDLLHVGETMVALPGTEARLLRHLLAAEGSLVARVAAAGAMWPDGPPSDPRALDNRLKELRRRITGLPIQITTVRGRGFVLEQRPAI